VNEKVFAYTQLKSELKDTASGWDDKLTGNVGISLMHANGFNIDLQYSKDLRTFENKDDVGQIQLQFRFRF
jgi:hypothetical protein